MRTIIFLSGIIIIALGFHAVHELGKMPASGFLVGCLTLGGGLLISSLFAIKSRWHGIIGAGMIALLATARGLKNIGSIALFFAGERERGILPLYELVILILSTQILILVVRSLFRERTKRMLAENESA